MTESEWLECRHPIRLLEVLDRRAGPRKLLWFGAACLARIRHLLSPPDRELISRFEQQADVENPAAAFRSAPSQLAREVCLMAGQLVRQAASKRFPAPEIGAEQDWISLPAKEQEAARRASEAQAVAAEVELAQQANLCRDVFGNPFQSLAIDSTWLQWNDVAVLRIARRIYQERQFGDMPLLGDFLEQAGCSGGAILDHCRGPSPHVRGCWVVDLILDKE